MNISIFYNNIIEEALVPKIFFNDDLLIKLEIKIPNKKSNTVSRHNKSIEKLCYLLF